MNYYRRYSGDYLRDTARLTLAEHGAYNLLMDYYYTEERPPSLDREELYLMLRAMRPDERKAVDKVLRVYFTEEADGFHQKRVDHEIAVSKKARTNGKFGGRPPGGNGTGSQTGIETGTITEDETDLETGEITGHETGHETETLTGSVHPPTTNHQPPTASLQPPASNHQPPTEGSKALARKKRSPHPGFADFWAHYPRKESRASAEKAWDSLHPDDALRVTIFASLGDHKRSQQWSDWRFIPHPATWLNQRRWESVVPRETIALNSQQSLEERNRRVADAWQPPPDDLPTLESKAAA